MSKESEEKKSTIDFSNAENPSIIEGKQAFYLLHEVRIKKGLSISELCRKIGMSNTSYHRYLRYYDKQQRNSPPLTIISKFADALGCEIQIVEKKSTTTQRVDSNDHLFEGFEGFEREFVYKTEFNVNDKAVKYKLLPEALLEKELISIDGEFQIYIRKHLTNEKLYDFYVSRVESPSKYLKSNGRVGAEYVYNTMEQYRINPFNQ